MDIMKVLIQGIKDETLLFLLCCLVFLYLIVKLIKSKSSKKIKNVKQDGRGNNMTIS